VSTVNNWVPRTPHEFVFSVKVPPVVTREKILFNFDAEFEQFVDTMDISRDKLGPMVFQFPFFNRSVFETQAEFLQRFTPFLKKLPQGLKFAVEIRNKAWLDDRLAEAPQYGERSPARRDAQYTVSPTQEIESDNQ
jgi:uncharacterized protein YecE (DUF72 family)